MSKAAAKLEKVRADRDRLFSEGKYYESLQLYKTLYSRATVRKSWSDARDIVVEGATALLQQKQSNPGGELALLLIELYTKSKQTCATEQATTILTLCSAFPPEGSEVKINFLKAAIKWSTTPTSNGSGWPDFHLALARTYRALSDFQSAHQHFLRSGGASNLVSLADAPGAGTTYTFFPTCAYIEDSQSLLSWAQNGGAPSEIDLFAVRAVLQYLCLEDISGANTVCKWFRQNQSSIATSPLMHFAEFLVETTQRGTEAVPLFDLLRHKYAPVIARDPAFDSYLDKIGEVFFGRTAPKGLMESMLSGLGAATPPPNAATSAQANTTSTTASSVTPAASEATAAPMATDVD